MESQTHTPPQPSTLPRPVEELETVVIRFCGDSGDGMQLTGTEFTRAAALAHNDLSTFPDFPAEIRAPAGTLAGVSGFQLTFSSQEVFTPGDQPDVLVAMNPAALKTNIKDLVPHGILIVNTGAFSEGNLTKAGYKSNPLEDGSLSSYRMHKIDISKLTQNALEGTGLGTKEIGRCKNFFALGLMFWMYNRPTEKEISSIKEKFAKSPQLAEANIKAFNAGYNYGETAEIFISTYNVPAASITPGKYRNITGNEATALGLLTAAQLTGLRLFLGSYPITPASDVLHTLSTYRHFGVTTFQAEDEIAGVCTALGAAFGGALGVTSTSGPGLALKGEAIGLALMVELPLVIIDVQRGGPSTGLPTKTEQADLLQAIYGRNSESPVAVVAASTPADCFEAAVEAARIATKFMTPVIYLTDGYLGNGAEPWLIPDVSKMPDLKVKFRTEVEGFFPYLRDDKTLARPWAVPGTPGLEHRIGGLEKDFLTGNVSYDPENHDKMVRTRAEKIARIADDIPLAEVFGETSGDLLIVGWGSTYGAIHQAVKAAHQKGQKVSHLHLRHLNPLPRNTGDLLSRFKKVLVPELNLGQLSKVLRSTFLVPAIGLNKIQGKPFKISEITAKINELLESH
jgi:2-oxoglutarate ferredoxin oxidoreductase subunit alpha